MKTIELYAVRMGISGIAVGFNEKFRSNVKNFFYMLLFNYLVFPGEWRI